MATVSRTVEPASVPTRPRPRVEIVLTAALVLLLLPTVCRALRWDAGPLAVVLAATPFVAMASVLLVVVAAAARQWRVLVAAALLAVVQVGWQVPVFVADGPAGTPDVTVLTVNLDNGRASVDVLAGLVSSHLVDVLAVQELTPREAARLQDAVGSQLPYQALQPGFGFSGSGLFSRWPLSSVRWLPGFHSAAGVASVAAPTGTLTVAVAHPLAPGALSHADWTREHEQLRSDLAGISGPLLLAGDLNATRDQPPVLDLEDDGFADAADAAGAGLVLTFPEHHGLAPPVVGIDHVLTRDLPWRATSETAYEVRGTDHRAVLVTYDSGTPAG